MLSIGSTLILSQLQLDVSSLAKMQSGFSVCSLLLLLCRCSRLKLKESLLCRAIEAQSATQSQFQGVCQLSFRIAISTWLEWNKIHCISTDRVQYFLSSSLRYLYLKYVLPPKLGNTNYDYDVFIVLIPPLP